MPLAIPLSERAKFLAGQLLAGGFIEAPSGQPATCVSLRVRSAIEDALARGETHYTDRPGILPLREKVAALLHARFGIAMNAKTDLLISCGVTEARFVAIQQLLAPGDTLAAPAAAERLRGAALLGRVDVVSTVPVVPAGADSMYLTSSSTEASLRSHLSAAAFKMPILYEVDDSGNSFHPAQVRGFEGRTVTIGALHVGARGDSDCWRVGYLASPAGLSPGMRDFKQALTICSTNLSQWAALAAVEAL